MRLNIRCHERTLPLAPSLSTGWGRNCTKNSFQRLQMPRTNFAVFPESAQPRGEAAGGVDADDVNIAVFKLRIFVTSDELPKPAIRIETSTKNTKERYVMVARNNNLRNRHPLQQPPGILILPLARPLGEIAADHDQVGLQLKQVVDERLDGRGVDPAEVEIGDVREGGHWCCAM